MSFDKTLIDLECKDDEKVLLEIQERIASSLKQADLGQFAKGSGREVINRVFDETIKSHS